MGTISPILEGCVALFDDRFSQQIKGLAQLEPPSLNWSMSN